MTESIRITFEDDPAPIDPREISDFLYLLSGTVEASLKIGVSKSFVPEQSASIDDAREKLALIAPSEWNQHFSADESNIFLERITRNSPLDIFIFVSTGCVTAVTLALILSGGNIKVKLPLDTGFEAELPPLGKGIKKLRKALKLDSAERQISFGLQEVKITLSREEFNELTQPVNGQGGFQHLLKKLQSKVNKSSRQITLSVEDLDKIATYRANPSAGGFQGRYNKIFKRHLEQVVIEIDPEQKN